MVYAALGALLFSMVNMFYLLRYIIIVSDHIIKINEGYTQLLRP